MFPGTLYLSCAFPPKAKMKVFPGRLLVLVSSTLAWLSAHAKHNLQVTPEEMNMSSEELAKMVPGIEKLYRNGKIPGAVVVVNRAGKEVFRSTVAYPTQEEPIFRLFSMTKPITAALTLMLVEEGLLHLDDPLEKFLPGFEKVQVRPLHQ